MNMGALFRFVAWAIMGCALAASVPAQSIKFFSIGTGGTGATYYPLAGTIANAISNPPGSRPCDQGGSCGVPGLIAVAQSSAGSLDNVEGIRTGRFQSGFCQSDVAHWAHSGTGPFAGKAPVSELRAIAALYPEHIQLIARKDASIRTVADLRGKRVSLDERNSGSYVNAIQILDAYGLRERDVNASFLKTVPAADAMIAGTLDAFFITSGYPTNAIIDLAARTEIVLVPIDGPAAKKIIEKFGFYSLDTIPAGTYPRIGATQTLAVGAQWLTSTRVDDDLVYAITKALWTEQSRKLLDVGHAKGKLVRLETALAGVGIPLHEGAARFYREAGALK